MFTTLLLLSVIAYLALHVYARYGRHGRLFYNIPGPSGYPIIGHIHLFAFSSSEKLWKIYVDLTDQYSIFKLWAFSTSLVSIRHPDDLEVILRSTNYIEKSRIYDALQPWLQTGLLTSGGAKWHTRRKILTPTFHFNILQKFVEILIEESESMTKSLKKEGGTVVKDLIPFLSEHTLNAICETAMGISLKGVGSFQQHYRNAVYQMGQIIVYRVMRPWLQNNWIFLLMPTGRKQPKILNILYKFTEKIIAERRNYHKLTNGQYLKNINNDVEEDDAEIKGTRKKRLAMLDLLILASEEGLLTDSDIKEEVDTFVFEGHDTTAMALCFALSLLAEHKDIQDRVRREINTVMQENQGKLTMKSLQDLPYLERCIKEALRLYPSVYFISRVTNEEVQLKSYLIPAGTVVQLNIYGVHRDPNFWPNPEVFDPDRFLPENIRNRHPYSYIPFSAGPRNCIGQRFAMLEMKAMMSHLIHNFYLEPVDYLKDLVIKGDLVMRSSNPMRVKFIPVASK
ncbi:PREDICTED: cytochrome P450 4C1-like isoform X1 [Vollenhovia emeryi]|uniref:cytochrome P450 4C1-like isoform X1 n=1 Tax=Vollenhovia emeryi TaxID=411798 RepID=UPI0005F4AA19|nr:PREDICTED: cytochrome P450 4C1-like isoform X1 [Vollenhovia emeryi]XP_011864533.1 PREDICTED: cytochrome P450 4C1-like isoform X1 [Vollenhovia emeryi]XP_011864534.1 PREDICTED: cytochrome P450 4C1-like isoform X1 [Vollenhovia emeryi]XP_011864535.1 PREDICTED: cytochrome P450 4C1-like isoform X1 [Vollenhovia emeryi]